jgi:type IV secretion system protein VirD4
MATVSAPARAGDGAVPGNGGHGHRGPRARFANPQHIGGVASTFRWSPVDGCQDPATAIRRADAFAFAVSQKGVEGLDPHLG